MISLLLSVFLAAGAGSARAATTYITPDMDAALMEGIDDIYRMKFPEAETAARRAMALNPDHPYAYFGLAGVSWTRYVYGTDQGDESLLEEFQERTDKAIDVSEKWLKAHPNDAEAMMILGASYGLSSRLLIIGRHWVKGYFQGRKALNLTRASVKMNPELWDAYLGLGMYDYYSDLYPRFIGVLAKLVLRGNRKRGIDYLKLVAEKGHFSKSNAKILLVEIYTEDPYGAQDPQAAAALMKDLREKYPDSAMMHSAQLVTLFTGGRFEELVDGAQQYVRLAQEGKYSAIELAKGYVMLGCGLWAVRRHEEALAAFRKAQEVRFGDRLTRWAVWAFVKSGNLLDALGRRSEAVLDYKAAAAQPDKWDIRGAAKALISKPYALAAPDRIPPP